MADKNMRDVYCEALIEAAAENKDIVVLDADLMGANGLTPFQSAFPDQFINVGVAEANPGRVRARQEIPCLTTSLPSVYAIGFLSWPSLRCYSSMVAARQHGCQSTSFPTSTGRPLRL